MNPNELHAEIEQLKSTQRELRMRLNAMDERIYALTGKAAVKADGAPIVVKKETKAPTPPPLPVGVVEENTVVSTVSAPPGSVPPPIAQLPARRESAESRFGRIWLARFGIFLVVAGLVFLGNYAWHEWAHVIGPAGRVACIFAVGVALLGLGYMLEQWRVSMRSYGRVLAAGGLAVQYYSLFAAHYVERLRVIESPVAGGILLLLSSSAMVGYAVWRNSQAVGTLGILLAFFAAAMNAVTGFTLLSNAILCGAAMFLLIRLGWRTVGGVALAAAYTSYAWWRIVDGIGLGQADESWLLRLAFLGLYWVTFSVPVLWKTQDAGWGRNERMVFGTGNNAAFFALGSFAVLSGDAFDYGYAALGFGVLFFITALLAGRLGGKGRRSLVAMFSAHAIIAVTVGFVVLLEGAALCIVLAGQAAVLAWTGVHNHPSAKVAGVAALLSGVLALVIGFSEPADPIATWTGLTVLFAAGAWFLDGLVRVRQRVTSDVVQSAIFGVMAAVAWIALAYELADDEWRIVWFAASALAFVLAFRLHTSRGLVASGLLIGVYGIFAAWGLVADSADGTAWVDLLALALLVAVPLAAGRRLSEWDASGGGNVVSAFMRFGAGALFVPWVADYIPAEHRMWVLVAAAIVLLVLSDSGYLRVRFFLAMGFAALGWVAFLSVWITGGELSWPMVIGGLLLVIMQQAGKLVFAAGRWPVALQWVLIFAGLAVPWVCLSDWAWASGGWLLTASWAVLAGVILAGGMALREAAVRWFAFVLLGFAFGRLVLVDVWELDTLLRIVSFLTLGVILLVAGFLYNRFQLQSVPETK